MSFIDSAHMREPFIEVSIGPPGALPEEMIVLPASLHVLIDNFTFSEFVDSGKGSASRIKLVFLEDQNKPGSILDTTIKNVGKTGKLVRYLDAQTLSEGKRLSEEAARISKKIASLIPSADVKEATKTLKLRETEQRNLEEVEKKIQNQAPLFMLQERNTIEVRWGYRKAGTEGKLKSRKIKGEILQITHRATESNIASTEVMAVDIGSGEMAKIYPKKGINFSIEQTLKLIKKAIPGPPNSASPDPRVTDTNKKTAPARLDYILQAVADSLLGRTRTNIQITEEEALLDIQDENSSRNWTQGMNLHEFLMKLADKIYAQYFVTTDFETNETVLNLISKRKFEEKNAFHFMWKSGLGGQGIDSAELSSLTFNTVKDFNLALYPGGGSGASSTGVCSNKKQITGHLAPVNIKFGAKMYEKRELIELRPQSQSDKDPNSEKALKDSTGEDSTGAPIYSAACKDNTHESLANRLAGKMERGLKLSFTTIGVPQLKPGVIKFSNIGRRYSGMYNLLSVEHKVDKSGYVCSCVGESNVVVGGGTDVVGPPVRNDLAAGVTLVYKEQPGEKNKTLGEQLQDEIDRNNSEENNDGS